MLNLKHCSYFTINIVQHVQLFFLPTQNTFNSSKIKLGSCSK